jgi:2-hydroxycyclohexanecarboxyl-CoA dehydrogenase
VRLEGKKALVTGGASGIGAAIARRLAAEGADVTIGDLNLEGATEVAGEISGLSIELDVTDLGSAQAAVDSAGPPLDILVNNAGTDEFGFFAQTTQEQWRKVVDVNLYGVLNCTYAALPGMQEAGYGRIVNIASEAGRVGSKGSAVYSAAKGGVIAFTKWVAKDAGQHGIAVNAVCPGPIESEMTRGYDYGVGAQPIARMGQARDVAQAVVFFASQMSNFVTGQTLNVDGGVVMD